jgi:hypothetical protein
VFVKKHGAVHLTGKADAGYILTAEIRARKRFANGEAGRAPPVFRMLLGPANLRRGKGSMIRGGGGDNAAVAVD